ncbi:HNH endonuclease domain protein [Geotalea daltonii FRC-32]|uniref:HNH endonuclease domain protein n=1 Tax=Geotalea daltonii (strain DSM 22248 / JCM 15807 / FRC-32) TaxID=316067 RepID=B9M291_GEODF|nr:HNH endonuclease signature motif containing protein [Geotalea daltonii]ACM21209.1 HNH endonuclease domain protein [Geotalea daltonii FRC-32]
MLRTITLVCQPALDACHSLQTSLILWLCEATRVAADVTAANLRALHASPIVGDWLVAFLNKEHKEKTLLSRAITIAALSVTEKNSLVCWLDASNNTANQFQNPPPAWPIKPVCSDDGWNAVKELLIEFYNKGLGEGVPFDQNGDPVAAGGVNRQSFADAFKAEHGERSCILCDGPFVSPEVDHWIAKKHFPGLSTASHNLIPICHDCNKRANKGEKPVWDNAGNAFDEWFHPVFRSAHGCFEPRHQMTQIKIMPTAVEHTERVKRLDRLINLSSRWTSEFKMQTRSYKNSLRGQIRRGSIQATTVDIGSELQELQLKIADENPPEANNIIRNLTLTIMQEPAKLEALLTELTT